MNINFCGGSMADIVSSKIDIKIPPYALCVMEQLVEAGEEVYLVGGSLRDALIGLDPHDYDMATSALPERVGEILKRFRVIETGLAHGTVTVISDSNPIEITTFRVDGDYLDSRHPESVSFTRSIEADLSRRDFTVNAMACSKDGELIDLFGGREDIKNKKIRAVGEAQRRFEEDALRIMRAFRFSAQLGFEIEPDTLDAAGCCKERLADISRERVGAEFVRLVCSEYPREPLMKMKQLGILPFALGDVSPDDALIDRLCLMPDTDVARLGFLLSGTPEEVARRALRGLRCSNRQLAGALAVARGSARCVVTRRDASLMRRDLGENAALAVRASVLLGNSGAEAIELVECDDTPVCFSDLAIDGADLCALGIVGRDVGKTLSHLLYEVMRDPTLNNRESLLSLAIKKQKEE